MGTKNGLNRYDGESFEIFTNDPENPNSIAGNYIHAIHDDVGFMLVGTNEALNIFDKETKLFYKIPIALNSPNVITNIIKDSLNQYWIAELNTGTLFQLILSNDFLNKVREGNNIAEVLSIKKAENVKNIYPFFISKYNDSLLLYVNQHKKKDGNWKKSFNTLNIKTGEVLKVNSESLIEGSDRYKYVVSNNRIVLSFWGENNIRVYNNNVWKTIEANFIIKTISYLQESKQILIENDNQYMIFDESILDNTKINNTEADLIITKIKANHSNWLQDKSGNYWIGTNGYGVVKVGRRQSKIKTHFTGKSIYAKPSILSSGDVYISNFTTQDHLFIQKTEQGITRLKRFTDVEDKDLYSLIEDRIGTIWSVYWEGGYFKIAKEVGEKIINVKNVNKSSRTVAPIMFYDAIEHKIVLTSNSELTIYDIDKNSLETYDFYKQFGVHIQRYIISRTSNGDYWIGTNAGLIQAKPINGNIEFKLYNKDNGLLSNEAAALYPDVHDNNILWIGTKGGGLHRLDISNLSFTYINSKNGLPNDVIYGVLEDDNYNLWLSSNLGLISYNKQTKEIRNFQKSDGLQSNEFNTYAYAKSKDGIMYFGGINGLNSFNPSDFNKNQNLPKLWITGLEVNNKKIKYGDTSGLLSKSVEYVKDITLPYSKNSITLSFAALEYTASDKNKFSYYLEGGEEKWTHTTTGNKANYLNLSPGNYTFKIKAANGDGVWSTNIKQLDITILAPWYRTDIAYIIYVLAGIALLLLIIRTRENKIKSKEQIEKSKLENKLLNQKLESNTVELKRFTSLLVKNSEETKALNEELEKIKNKSHNPSFENIESLLKTRILTDKQWLLFKEKFTAVHPDFFNKLRNKPYTFSEAEERLLVLEKLNLKPKEMAAILGIAGPSVSRAKHRLKTKLSIDKTINIIDFLGL